MFQKSGGYCSTAQAPGLKPCPLAPEVTTQSEIATPF